MIRTRTLIGPLVVAAALIVFGIHRVAASPAPTTTAPTTETPVVQIDDAAKTWHIAGTIQMMNGEFWDVQGFVVQVTNTTSITGDLPSIGTYVDARGTVQPDGTWVATAIVVGGTAPTMPSPTSSPTATPPNTPTPVATATPSATATATPSATATPTTQPEDDDSGSGHASSATPVRSPLVLPPGVTIIRNLLPEKNPHAADKQENPHSVHPPPPPAHQHNSGDGHGRGHGQGHNHGD